MAVFKLNDDSAAEVKADPVPPEAEDNARKAAEGCPVEVITIKD